MSRRGFISGTATGLAVAGVALVVPGQVAGATMRTTAAHVPATDDRHMAASLAAPLVAHVRDLPSGEIALFTGEQEIIVRDRDLAFRLAHATGGR